MRGPQDVKIPLVPQAETSGKSAPSSVRASVSVLVLWQRDHAVPSVVLVTGCLSKEIVDSSISGHILM